ncbi:MAG: hypothetical protein AB7V10_05570, partial [Leucobacter sp.]
MSEQTTSAGKANRGTGETPPAASAAPRRPGFFAALPRRVPFTLVFLVALLAVGAASGTLFAPTSEQPWFDQVATGLPAFAEGRWWTLATALFFVKHPLVYLTLLPLVAGGVGWAECRFGSLRAMGLFAAGQVVGVLGAAAILLPVARTGWPWAVKLSETPDLGPSCGALAALVFAIATLPAPWRLRARLLVGIWVGISVLYLGRIDDLEHAVTLTAALVVSGLLPAFRRPAGRPTQREWRLIAFSALIAIGAIQVIDLVVPYDGPLGANEPGTSLVDVAIDVIVIALIANGIRLGYRIAWIVVLVLAAFNIATAVVVIALLPVLVESGALTSEVEAWGLVLGPALFWLALAILLVLARGAFRVRLRRSRRALASEPLTREQHVERL